MLKKSVKNTLVWLMWLCGCICYQVLAGVCLPHCSETVTLASSYSALPDDGHYTETCWSCFNVNFNTPVKHFSCASVVNEIKYDCEEEKQYTVLNFGVPNNQRHCVTFQILHSARQTATIFYCSICPTKVFVRQIQ